MGEREPSNRALNLNYPADPTMSDPDAVDQPTFSFNQVYVKDFSFESPDSPQIFSREFNPKIDIQLNVSHQVLDSDNGVFEAVLSCTVTAKTGEETAFLAECQQAGVFTLNGYDESTLEQVLEGACPNMLFPYLRETVGQMVAKGGFPHMLLSPVNFDVMYQNKKAAEQTSAGNGSGAEPN
jgi:preprotein translocase subunit SecB